MAENNEKNENAYKEAFSKIKKFRLIMVVLLIAFVIFAVFSYREDLTVENFRYLMKYVSVTPITLGSEGSAQITFESDSSTVTSSFREDLVVLTKSDLKIYDLNSKEVLSSPVALLRPAISVGEKYFAVWDVGERYVGIFNSFSKLWENEFEYPVLDVSLEKEGNFCIVTGAKDYTSAVKVYDDTFSNVFNWRSADKYTVAADLHTLDTLFVAAATVKNDEVGSIVSGLTILSTSSKEIVKAHAFEDEMVLDCAFNDEGNIVYLTDRAIRFFNCKGQKLGEYQLSSKALRKFEVGGKYTVLVLNDNLVGKKHRMIIFDASGNTHTETDIETEVTDVSLSDSFVSVLGVEDVSVLDLKTKKLRTYDSDRSYRSIEQLDTENVYMVYDGHALAVGVVGK